MGFLLGQLLARGLATLVSMTGKQIVYKLALGSGKVFLVTVKLVGGAIIGMTLSQIFTGN